MAKKSRKSRYRAIHQLRKGGLQRAMRLKDGEEMTPERLEAAMKSKNGHVSMMAEFAKRMRDEKKSKG